MWQIRRCVLWEVTRISWVHAGGALKNGLNVLVRMVREFGCLLCCPQCEDVRCLQCTTQKKILTRN